MLASGCVLINSIYRYNDKETQTGGFPVDEDDVTVKCPVVGKAPNINREERSECVFNTATISYVDLLYILFLLIMASYIYLIIM